MPGCLALLILGRLGVQERKKRSRKTRKEVGSETEEVVTGALKVCCHTGVYCWSAGSALEEGLHPFSVSFVSMTMI